MGCEDGETGTDFRDTKEMKPVEPDEVLDVGDGGRGIKNDFQISAMVARSSLHFLS